MIESSGTPERQRSHHAIDHLPADTESIRRASTHHIQSHTTTAPIYATQTSKQHKTNLQSRCMGSFRPTRTQPHPHGYVNLVNQGFKTAEVSLRHSCERPNLLAKGLRYLSTVKVTAAVSSTFRQMLLHPLSRDEYVAGVSSHPSSYDFAQTCVFVKQSHLPMICGSENYSFSKLPLSRTYGVILQSSLNPFLSKPEWIVHPPTWVGLQHGATIRALSGTRRGMLGSHHHTHRRIVNTDCFPHRRPRSVFGLGTVSPLYQRTLGLTAWCFIVTILTTSCQHPPFKSLRPSLTNWTTP